MSLATWAQASPTIILSQQGIIKVLISDETALLNMLICTNDFPIQCMKIMYTPVNPSFTI